MGCTHLRRSVEYSGRDGHNLYIRMGEKAVEPSQPQGVALPNGLDSTFHPHQIADDNFVSGCMSCCQSMGSPPLESAGVIQVIDDDDAIQIHLHVSNVPFRPWPSICR